ncbi:unannotated protein [freshwater metagenome]|uniref:Unannotated protein n=1 Tax=freshwater metagenome TaxID=449393 RepID=A0A6J7IQ28_9ZZZZ
MDPVVLSPATPTDDPFRRLLADSDLLALRDAREADLRARPTTARGIQTVENLLHAARALITLGDVRDLTTIAIAAYANVNVATLYRYFRDVDAVLREITLRREIEAAELLATGLAGFARSSDWRAYSDSIVEGMSQHWNTSLDRGALVLGLRGVSGIWPIIRAGHEANAELIALALHQRDDRRSEQEWLAVARPLVVTVREGLNYAYLTDPPDDPYIAELKTLTAAYAACYLPD